MLDDIIRREDIIAVLKADEAALLKAFEMNVEKYTLELIENIQKPFLVSVGFCSVDEIITNHSFYKIKNYNPEDKLDSMVARLLGEKSGSPDIQVSSSSGYKNGKAEDKSFSFASGSGEAADKSSKFPSGIGSCQNEGGGGQ